MSDFEGLEEIRLDPDRSIDPTHRVSLRSREALRKLNAKAAVRARRRGQRAAASRWDRADSKLRRFSWEADT